MAAVEALEKNARELRDARTRLSLPIVRPPPVERPVTDLEYGALSILLDSKQISLRDLKNIDSWVAGGDPVNGWGWLITWLQKQPDIPLKPRLRVGWPSPGTPKSGGP